jgi:hypothetical protein
VIARILPILLALAMLPASAAQPSWPAGTVAKPAKINFEVRIPGAMGDAAVRAVARWDAETCAVGLKLTTTRPWLRLDRPKPKNGRNEIWLGQTAEDGWGDTVRQCNWGGRPLVMTEADIRLDADRPYTADYVYRVTLHEIGHALGLEHLENSQAMMFYRGPAFFTDLQPADVAALRKLYQVPKKK